MDKRWHWYHNTHLARTTVLADSSSAEVQTTQPLRQRSRPGWATVPYLYGRQAITSIYLVGSCVSREHACELTVHHSGTALVWSSCHFVQRSQNQHMCVKLPGVNRTTVDDEGALVWWLILKSLCWTHEETWTGDYRSYIAEWPVITSLPKMVLLCWGPLWRGDVSERLNWRHRRKRASFRQTHTFKSDFL